MPGKVQAYVEMANETAASITQDAEAWMQFLRHSARFYKYSFNDQSDLGQLPDQAGFT